MEPIKKPKIGEIFSGNTFLHLVIWDRFCETKHIRGLELMKKIVQKFDLAMPMLRPIGRRFQTYRIDYMKEFVEPPPNTISNEIPAALLLPGDLTGHCEMWIQAENSIDNGLKDFLQEEIGEYRDFGVFFEYQNPIWGALGESMQKCTYAGAREGLGTKILCDLGETQAPAFLKLIWYRSSVVIAEWLSTQGENIPWIDPLAQKNLVCDLMKKIFEDINLEEYGISSSYASIDPSSFGVAHMAAFAVNAITRVTPVYQLEQYFQNNKITHPYFYPSRDEFLKDFCN